MRPSALPAKFMVTRQELNLRHTDLSSASLPIELLVTPNNQLHEPFIEAVERLGIEPS